MKYLKFLSLIISLFLIVSFSSISVLATTDVGFIDYDESNDLLDFVGDVRGVREDVSCRFYNTVTSRVITDDKIGSESYSLIRDSDVHDVILVMDDFNEDDFVDDYSSFDEVKELDLNLEDSDLSVVVINEVDVDEIFLGYKGLFSSSMNFVDDDRVLKVYSNEVRSFEIFDVVSSVDDLGEEEQEEVVGFEGIDDRYNLTGLDYDDFGIDVALLYGRASINNYSNIFCQNFTDRGLGGEDGDMSTFLLDLTRSVTNSANISVIDVIDDGGDGYGVKPSALIEGVDYSIRNDIEVVSFPSLDVYHEGSFYELISLIENWDDSIYVTNAGDNADSYSNTPAIFENVMSVGSVGEDGYLSDYSNLYFHLSARGELVKGVDSGGDELIVSSTIVSSVLFSGMLALSMGEDSDLIGDYEEVRKNFCEKYVRYGPDDLSGDLPIDVFGWDNYLYGFGEVDIRGVGDDDYEPESPNREMVMTFWAIRSWRGFGRSV